MTATDSYLLLRALVDEFARCGMEHACTSPGSRDTPIVLTLARDGRIRCWSHVDERCAGFFALGAARASGRPVAVTCTSGTAAANLLPAVIEAREARVPLIVLTADRPPELREVGAGQTIDQVKLYGDAVKWFVELDLPDATPERLRFIRTLACRAYWTAAEGAAGPVHLNIPLREPLVLDEPLPPGEPGGGGRAGGAPYVAIDSLGHAFVAAGGGPLDGPIEDVVIVAGGLGSPDARLGRRLADLAARARVPLLADPLSNARSGEAAIVHYDLILRDPTTARELAPRAVWRIGELPTSKPLRAWLAGLAEIPQVAFAPPGGWTDPDGRLATLSPTPVEALLERLEAGEVGVDDGEYLSRWRAADAAVAAGTAATLGASALSEPAVARTLATVLPEQATLFVAASMPVRDLETWMPARDAPVRVLANRGANGIDGTVSSAFGVAATGQGPVVLLIGDVALAHDVGGLLAARRTQLPLTIVLVNNDGGGIFHFLAVAGEGADFERHIATPTGLPFDQIAAAYGCAYERPSDLDSLAAAVTRSLGVAGTTIIEVRTDRAANRELHQRLQDDAVRACRSFSRRGSGAARPA
jgi:2-succinyl-5-enolpyruvyl-6-hydroxy-3-cyclohexene-1-carboxylate synthase